MAAESTLKLTNNNFDAEVTRFQGTVMVDFFADWCVPCRVLGPVVDDLARAFRGAARITKLNIDEAPEIADRYEVRSIPTLMFFKNGEAVGKIVGVATKGMIERELRSYL